jgi:hypothetical protein
MRKALRKKPAAIRETREIRRKRPRRKIKASRSSEEWRVTSDEQAVIVIIFAMILFGRWQANDGQFLLACHSPLLL